MFLHSHFYLLAFLHDPQHTLLSISPPQHTAGSRRPGANYSTITLQLPHPITTACACKTLSCLGEPLHSPKSPRHSGTWLRERGKGKLKQHFVFLWHMYVALIKLYWMAGCFFFSYADGPLPVHICFEQKAHVTCCFIQRHQPQCFVPVIIFINFKQSVVLHRSEWPYYRKFICTLFFFFLVINSYILSWLEKRTGNSVLFPCLIISHQSQYTNTSLSTPWKICKKNKLYQFSAGERKS